LLTAEAEDMAEGAATVEAEARWEADMRAEVTLAEVSAVAAE
jgi:hypothetical protein